MNHNRNDLIDAFFTDPDSLYEGASGLDPDTRKALYSLEEFFVGLLQGQHAESLREKGSVPPEMELAEWVERLEAEGEATGETYHEFLSRYPDAFQAIQQILDAKKVMMDGHRKPVPPLLMEVVRRSETLPFLRKETPAAIPAIVLGLARDGLRMIKSTLQGMAYIPQAVVATRAASPSLMEKGKPRLELRQSLGSASDPHLRYEILRESDREIMLTLHFENKIGPYRVSLKQEGRILDSRIVGKSEESLQFSRLTPGDYTVEIRGGLDHEFGIMIRED